MSADRVPKPPPRRPRVSPDPADRHTRDQEVVLDCTAQEVDEGADLICLSLALGEVVATPSAILSWSLVARRRLSVKPVS